VTAGLAGREHVTFAVADTGIGIAREHLGAIFQDFVQVDSPIQKRLRGTGLGLSLSKKLAGILGGDVAVESEPGVGSRFSVTIPLRLPGHGGDDASGAAGAGAAQPDGATAGGGDGGHGGHGGGR
jgi:signal transduction histidine kinase